MAEGRPVDETRRLPIKRAHLPYLYRALGALCVLAALWTLLLWVTGGFRVDIGGLRISSRRPRNAFAISLACAALIWLLTLLPGGRSAFLSEWARWRQSPALRWPWSRRARSALVAAAVIGIAALAAIDIWQWRTNLPLWVDEEMIALNVRDRSVADLSGTLWLGQSAPYGWLILERAAITMFGTGEAALRAAALLFGLAASGTAAWVGRRWMGAIGATVFVLMCWIGQWLGHYRFEVKHYTADALFGLLLPALAVWAIESDRAAVRVRRVWVWWMVAAAGHWLANGALLATPACAIFLCVVVWRRDGLSGVKWFAGGWLMWLASFGVHYMTSIRYTLNNAFLLSVWSAELLPLSLGPAGVMRWYVDRLEPLALNPGGTALWILFWASALAGFVFSARRHLAVALAGIPASAFVFAAVVPLHQRFAIWIVPALYAGVALLIDRIVAAGAAAFARRQWPLVGTAVLVLAVQYPVVFDVLDRGKVDIAIRLRAVHKHRLDDRAAVRWLMSHAEPGDALITTHLSLPAVWWYGNIPLSDEAGAGGILREGGPIYEVDFPADCRSRTVEDMLRNRSRVLLYLGFDVIDGLDRILLRNLSQLGDVTAHAAFGELGRTAVIDLRITPSSRMMQLERDSTARKEAPDVCVSLQPAKRW